MNRVELEPPSRTLRHTAMHRLLALPLILVLAVVPAMSAHASTLSSDAKALRTEAAQTMETYLDLYGDRLSTAERTTLTSLSNQADAELARVQRSVTRAERIPATKPAKKATALRTALRVHARAEASAEESLNSARTILEKRLTFLEALNALNDYSALMDSYRDLGTALEKQVLDLR